MKCNAALEEQENFRFWWSKIEPDIVPIAKGIGVVPLGACLLNKSIKMCDSWHTWIHFRRNPLAMSVANADMTIS